VLQRRGSASIRNGTRRRINNWNNKLVKVLLASAILIFSLSARNYVLRGTMENNNEKKKTFQTWNRQTSKNPTFHLLIRIFYVHLINSQYEFTLKKVKIIKIKKFHNHIISAYGGGIKGDANDVEGGDRVCVCRATHKILQLCTFYGLTGQAIFVRREMFKWCVEQ
jgi:hypothetical protein